MIRSLIDSDVVVYDETTQQWHATRRVEDIAIPDTLQGVLMARIDRLKEETKRVLRLASVIGRMFLYRVLTEIAVPGPVAWEEQARPERSRRELDAHLSTLQREEMILERARLPELEYIFKHHLTQEVAYNGLLRRERRRFHRRVAEALERLFPDRIEEQLGLLAHHWEGAGEPERAVYYLRRAGERAAAHFANAEAVAYFSRALDLLPLDAAPQTPERRVERYTLLLARERVYDLQGDREAQERDLVALERLAESLGDSTKQAEVAVRRVRYLNRIDQRVQAVSAARAAVQLAKVAQDVRSEAIAYREWAQAAWDSEDQEERQRYLERALALARDAGLRQIEADVLQTLGYVFGLSSERGMECWEQALSICREIGERRREGELLRDLGFALSYRGNLSESEEYLRQAMNVSRETGSRLDEARTLHYLSIISSYRGDFARTRNQVEQVLRISREIRDRYMEGEAVFVLGRAHIELADYATARDYLEQGLRIYRQRGSRVDEGWGLVYLGQVFHLQGDYTSAERYYEQALNIGRETGRWTVEARALMHTALLSHHLGDDHAARKYSQQTLAAMPNMEESWVGDLYYVYTVLGHALAGLRHPAEAADAYREALTLHRQNGQPHLAPEPLSGLARVALARGDRAGALAHVQEILDYVKDHPALEGAWEPMCIYLTCYRVLQANADLRADEILDAAYRLLQERAARIDDKDLQRSYRENVAANREIVVEYERWRSNVTGE